MKKSYGLLVEYFQFEVKHLHRDGYPSENLLYRWGMEGEVQSPPPKDKILCEDMPPHLRKVAQALKGFPSLESRCLWIYFCAPLREDQKPYTKSQLAKMLHVNKGKFKAELKKGISRAERLL